MHVIIGLALGLLVVGLLSCYLSGSVKYPLLVAVVFWVGVVLVVIALILLITPVLVYLNSILRQMLSG